MNDLAKYINKFPITLQWKRRVLTTGPPGKSQAPAL